jgi:hypothetical protein
MKYLLWLSLFLILLSSCANLSQQPASSSAEPIPKTEDTSQQTSDLKKIEIQIDQPFRLQITQQASLLDSDANLSIQFLRLLEDSRCPRNVTCVWEGQARVQIQIQTDTDATQTIELSSNPNLTDSKTAYETSGYRIEFLKLEPYPISPDQRIKQHEYLLSLKVSRLN